MRVQQLLKVARIMQKKILRLSMWEIEKIKKMKRIDYNAYNKAREVKGTPLNKKYLFSQEENNYRVGKILERFKVASK